MGTSLKTESISTHSRVPDAPLKGFVDERFKDPSPPKVAPFLPCLLSILSLVAMAASAVYMAKLLKDPSQAFQILKKVKTSWLKRKVPRDIETWDELLQSLPCFFNFTEKAGWNCNINDVCQNPTCMQDAALWTLLPFYFTVWGAGLGAVFETGLLLAGKPFQQNSSPFTNWISRLRFLNLAFVSTSIFFFVVCMTVPKEHVILLQVLKYAMVALALALAPALYFGGLESGGFDFMPPLLLGIQMAEFIFIISRGAVFGGPLATYTLALVPLVQTAAYLVTTSTPMKSFGFHVLSALAGTLLFVALQISGNESPDFPLILEHTLQSQGSTRDWPFLLLAAVLGFSTMMTIAPKVYQNSRSELSYCVWSIVYYVLVGGPSPPQPYRLSAIFADSNKPTLTTLQPYSEQHPYDMSPNLGIPAIRDVLPQTVEANSGSLMQKVTKFFNLISRLDYFIPQANATTY